MKQDIPPNLPHSILYNDIFLKFGVIVNFWTGIPSKKHYLLFIQKESRH